MGGALRGPLETPYASHAEAALVESRARLATATMGLGWGFSFRPTGWVTRSRTTSWYAAGVGLVGEIGERRVTKRGRLQASVSYELWLREGVIGGVPYPPP